MALPPSRLTAVLLFLSLADGEDSTVSIQIKLENEGSDEELETDMLYSPQLALKLALTEWLGEFCVPRQYNGENKIPFYLRPAACFGNRVACLRKRKGVFCFFCGHITLTR